MCSMHCDLSSWGKKIKIREKVSWKWSIHPRTLQLLMCVDVYRFQRKRVRIRKLLYLQISTICFRPTEGAAKHTQSFRGDHLFYIHAKSWSIWTHHSTTSTGLSFIASSGILPLPQKCRYWHLHLQTSWPPRRPSSSVPETRSWATNHSFHVIYFASSLAKLVDNYYWYNYRNYSKHNIYKLGFKTTVINWRAPACPKDAALHMLQPPSSKVDHPRHKHPRCQNHQPA